MAKWLPEVSHIQILNSHAINCGLSKNSTKLQPASLFFFICWARKKEAREQKMAASSHPPFTHFFSLHSRD